MNERNKDTVWFTLHVAILLAIITRVREFISFFLLLKI